jgi:hypothetical protein
MLYAGSVDDVFMHNMLSYTTFLREPAAIHAFKRRVSTLLLRRNTYTCKGGTHHTQHESRREGESKGGNESRSEGGSEGGSESGDEGGRESEAGRKDEGGRESEAGRKDEGGRESEGGSEGKGVGCEAWHEMTDVVLAWGIMNEPGVQMLEAEAEAAKEEEEAATKEATKEAAKEATKGGEKGESGFAEGEKEEEQARKKQLQQEDRAALAALGPKERHMLVRNFLAEIATHIKSISSHAKVDDTTHAIFSLPPLTLSSSLLSDLLSASLLSPRWAISPSL